MNLSTFVLEPVEHTTSMLYLMLWSNWGLAIIFLAIFTKLILYPVSIIISNYQNSANSNQAKLDPIIRDITAKYKGEEAHDRIIKAHKLLKISPFYKLKPLIGLFIQIPLLVIVFNSLAKMPALQGASFLWISDLSKPDIIFHFSDTIPYLGSGIHLLPLLMTFISCLSTFLYQNTHLSEHIVKREKIKVYLMNAFFLAAFYPFPASMVLYWTSMNALQLFQQQLFWFKGHIKCRSHHC